MAADTTFVIMKIYKEMLDNGSEFQAHVYREMIESSLSQVFDKVDRLHEIKDVKDKRPPAEIQELLDEIMKRRR